MHDNIVEDIEYLLNENKVQIKLDLCQWKQANYDESEPEMQAGVLTFTDVGSFQIEPPKFMINSNEILEVKVQDDKGNIEIILAGNDDVGKVCIVAQDVYWEVCD
ncbi:hypothetical protein F4V43_13540 [Paenibacillus spiritus]|uniref:Uncharacterized protein n=1 Tax=Paenibacillus spiritus TaxID=2496557 RepID=A0A5J5G4V0_9BACL|nr:hypothetical protein [Paenibacillus spiritus]KAA9002079.1 hypothetical protein F4V43_13540 [Paenibacillus spiritus]